MKKLFHHISILAIISFGVANLPQVAQSAFNPQINYQGKLTDSSNVAVADGNYNMEFKLYTVASGGTAIWTETRTLTDRVTVTNGLFSVLLGEVASLSSVDFNQTLYLGVNIGGTADTPSWDGEMTPREKLGVVPAAFEADKLDGIDSLSFLRSDAADTMSANSASTLLTVTQSGTGDILNVLDGSTEVFTILDGGNVGIASTSPATTLSVTGNGYLTGGFGVGLLNTTAGTLQTSGNATIGGNLTVSGTDTTLVNASTTQLSVSSNFYTSLTSGSVPFIGSSGLLSQDNSNLYWDNTNKRLGIGTTTPNSGLSVVDTLNNATGDETAFAFNYTTNKATSGNDYGLVINFTDTASPGDSRPFRLIVNGTEKFAIKETGDLTFQSGGKLVDNVNENKYFQMSDGGGYSILRQYNGYKFQGYDGGAYSNQLVTKALLNQSSGSYDFFAFTPTVRQSGTASYTAISLDVTEASIGSGISYLMDLGVGGTSKFNVTNIGNVGISTTSPGSLLSVGNTNGINFSTATSTFSSTGGINLSAGCFAVNGVCVGGGSGGGSGTVTSVDMSVPTGLTISGNPITTSGTLALGLATGYNIPLTASTTNWNNFYDAPSTVINAGTNLSWNGNTLNVDDAFLVNNADDATTGQLTAANFISSSATATSTFAGGLTVDTNGLIYDYSSNKVGIGTASPNEKLEIAYGNFRMNRVDAPASTTPSVNTSAGNLTGTYYYRITFVTADGETEMGALSDAVSPSSQQVNLTNIPTGPSNVIARKIYRTKANPGFNGYTDMYFVATINDNTTTSYTDNVADSSLGAAGPGNNTTGGGIYINSNRILESNSLNLSLGYNAGGATDSKELYNTFIGPYTGYSNTSGYHNTFLGTKTGWKNTTGYFNTFIGMFSGYYNTTGSENYFGGMDAGLSNTSGSANVALGIFTGWGLTTGTGNVLIGYKTGYKVGSGVSNTMVGRGAGYESTGSNNVFLGYQAGLNSTGSGNVLIGNQAGSQLTTESNRLYIENSNSATPLIYGNFSTDVLTFYTSQIYVGKGTGVPSIKANDQAAGGFLIMDSAGTGGGAALNWYVTDDVYLAYGGGNVGIRTGSPDSALQVSGGGLCVGSDANCNTDNNTEGVVYSSATAMTVYDVAENYPTKDTSLEAAEIVSLDPDNGVFVKRASSTQERILGVISTDPAVLLGGFNGSQFKEEHQVPVGLSGRIPVKVNLEGGPIRVGDYLTLSSVPGVAKKATDFEQTIGYALEDYTATTSSSTIQFFMNVGTKTDFNSNKFTVTDSGNIGIGTTTPAHKLHVEGEAAAKSFVVLSGNERLTDIDFWEEDDYSNALKAIKGTKMADYRYLGDGIDARPAAIRPPGGRISSGNTLGRQ